VVVVEVVVVAGVLLLRAIPGMYSLCIISKQDILSFLGTCFVHKFKVVNAIYKSVITWTVLELMLEKSGLV
jgi:hypothetical protein